MAVTGKRPSSLEGSYRRNELEGKHQFRDQKVEEHFSRGKEGISAATTSTRQEEGKKNKVCETGARAQ